LNLRRQRRQIYSLLPLTTRAPPHELLARRRMRMIPKGQGHYKKARHPRAGTNETPVLPHRGLSLEREEGGTPGLLVSTSFCGGIAAVFALYYRA
jgi:hypothetical protein